jgi:myo-inositol 2-dehydrogenase/D-chiro-inositol 1-dehydrogenase
VIVASSTDTHLDYSIRAIEAGKAVFCEKPIDMSLSRARAAENVLGSARMFVGFNRRFDPHFARVQAGLSSGEMGVLETLHIISHDPAPPPIDYVKISGGLFKDMAIHDFDMARWLLGEEVTGIYACASCLVDPAIGAAGDVDTAKTMLRTASGRICVISNSRRSGYGYDQRIEAYCSKGLIRAGNVHETTVERWGEGGAGSDPLQNFFLDRYAAAFQAEMTHFADVVEGKADPKATYADALAALALAEAAEQSVKAQAVVAPA